MLCSILQIKKIRLIIQKERNNNLVFNSQDKNYQVTSENVATEQIRKN